jgi:hypothetical protein
VQGDPAILNQAGVTPDDLIADRIVGDTGNIHYRVQATVEVKCKPPFFLQDIPGVGGVTQLQIKKTSAHVGTPATKILHVASSSSRVFAYIIVHCASQHSCV